MLLLVNFFLLGTSRLRALISGSAAQGVLLGLLVLSVHAELTAQAVLIAIATIALKSSVIPAMLKRAMRDLAIHREVEPVIGFVPSLLLGGLGPALSLALRRTLPLPPSHLRPHLVPASPSSASTS